MTASVDTFKDRAGSIYNSPNNIKVVDAASLPAKPYNVNALMQIGLATAAALFIAIVALFFVYDYTNSNPARTRATKKGKKVANKKSTHNFPKFAE